MAQGQTLLYRQVYEKYEPECDRWGMIWPKLLYRQVYEKGIISAEAWGRQSLLSAQAWSKTHNLAANGAFYSQFNRDPRRTWGGCE
jgi:hypothetical protein